MWRTCGVTGDVSALCSRPANHSIYAGDAARYHSKPVVCTLPNVLIAAPCIAGIGSQILEFNFGDGRSMGSFASLESGDRVHRIDAALLDEGQTILMLIAGSKQVQVRSQSWCIAPVSTHV